MASRNQEVAKSVLFENPAVIDIACGTGLAVDLSNAMKAAELLKASGQPHCELKDGKACKITDARGCVKRHHWTRRRAIIAQVVQTAGNLKEKYL
ncbi:MAG: hypothetical protein AMJ54_06585 [Deltaproteobacteria bacterium SG8_13]|nr:MAG: hypothetical protein AMJ54_06585 [Deltaproteobacteria bacterium SG8_13]